MSLYSSIDVPLQDRKPVKKAGFAGLYEEATPAETNEAVAEPSTLIETVPEIKPNAALQFTPSTRHRPAAAKRKASDLTHEVTGSKAPRLDVINSFEDYKDFQPDGVEHNQTEHRPSRRRKKAYVPMSLGWDEDYNPAQPVDFHDYMSSDVKLNDREEYRAHRIVRQKRAQGLPSDSEDDDDESRPSFGAIPPPPPPPRADPPPQVDTAEDAYARRAALAIPSPSPSTNQSAASIRQNQPSFAQRYMASHGWKKGQGLGTAGRGRLAPLFIRPQKDGTGKIVDRHKPGTAIQTTSRIVSLMGLIEGEVDPMMQQEIGDLCSVYGNVERVVLVPSRNRVLVQFVDGLSALRCISNVADSIDGREVSALQYPETRFEERQYED